MAEAVIPVMNDRRAMPRSSADAWSGLARARLRPGKIAQVLNLSPGGALLETDWRLLPGARVELQLGDPAPQFTVKGRIARCHVTLLARERVRYRAALAFDTQLALGDPLA